MLTRQESLDLVKRLRALAIQKPGLSLERRQRLMQIATMLQQARTALDRKNAQQKVVRLWPRQVPRRPK